MLIAQYFDIFIYFSALGWIYESTFDTIKKKHWDNRGFLFGPICPIYGSSVVIAMILFTNVPFFEKGYKSPIWQVFLICCVLSAIIEYVTSYVLERIFHAVWWDYSKIPLNINGRVCLPATLGFGAAGVLIVRFVIPWVESLSMSAHPYFNEALSLFFMLLLGIDITFTVSSLTDMLGRMEEIQKNFDQRMQAGYEIAAAGPSAVVNAAKNSAYVAKKELSDNVSEYMKNISLRDRHHLRNIQGFRSEHTKITAERIRESFMEKFMNLDKHE